MSRVQGTAEEEPLGSRSSVPRCERDSPPSPGPAGNWRHRPRRTYDLGPCSQEPLESRERNGGSCGTCAEPTCSPRRRRRPAPPAAVHYGTSSSPARRPRPQRDARRAWRPRGMLGAVGPAWHAGSPAGSTSLSAPATLCPAASCISGALAPHYTRRRPSTGLRLCCGGCVTG